MINQKLIESLNKLEATQVKLASRKQSFLRGMYYGLGFFVGGTLIVTILLYLLSFFDTAPVVGEYISEILLFIK